MVHHVAFGIFAEWMCEVAQETHTSALLIVNTVKLCFRITPLKFNAIQ